MGIKLNGLSRKSHLCLRCALLAALTVLLTAFTTGCSKKHKLENIQELDTKSVTHAWYYLTGYSVEKTDLPQHAPSVLHKPWTEAVRISCAASVPGTTSSPYKAYALVNRAGILALKENTIELFCDNSLFPNETADGLVFSWSRPVFYFYRSTFFNETLLQQSSLSQDLKQTTVNNSRSFLVQFNPQSKLCYPLVSYNNIKLNEEDQITGYFWNGKTWACGAKTLHNDRVEFKYFCWEPLIALTEMTPALNANNFNFSELTERKYQLLNTPQFFNDAPSSLKKLLSSIPKNYPLFITWRDSSGTSPVGFYQEGDGSTPLNAQAQLCESSGFTTCVFNDGTTYLMENESGTITAFRLPKLPRGYSYSEFAIAGNTLYVGWEEKSFYKTGRAGILQVNLKEVLRKDVKN